MHAPVACALAFISSTHCVTASPLRACSTAVATTNTFFPSTTSTDTSSGPAAGALGVWFLQWPAATPHSFESTKRLQAPSGTGRSEHLWPRQPTLNSVNFTFFNSRGDACLRARLLAVVCIIIDNYTSSSFFTSGPAAGALGNDWFSSWQDGDGRKAPFVFPPPFEWGGPLYCGQGAAPASRAASSSDSAIVPTPEQLNFFKSTSSYIPLGGPGQRLNAPPPRWGRETNRSGRQRRRTSFFSSDFLSIIPLGHLVSAPFRWPRVRAVSGPVAYNDLSKCTTQSGGLGNAPAGAWSPALLGS